MTDVDLSLELKNVQNSKNVSSQIDPVSFCHSFHTRLSFGAPLSILWLDLSYIKMLLVKCRDDDKQKANTD